MSCCCWELLLLCTGSFLPDPTTALHWNAASQDKQANPEITHHHSPISSPSFFLPLDAVHSAQEAFVCVCAWVHWCGRRMEASAAMPLFFSGNKNFWCPHNTFRQWNENSFRNFWWVGGLFPPWKAGSELRWRRLCGLIRPIVSDGRTRLLSVRSVKASCPVN